MSDIIWNVCCQKLTNYFTIMFHIYQVNDMSSSIVLYFE